ncbi:MAG: helix-turn-helix domain-containing protein [Actinomycetota bacterium]
MVDSKAQRRLGGRPARSDELTDERLGDAALSVIRTHGADGLTRALVAEAAGVSARATYRLTPSTDDLVALAVNEWQRRWQPPTDTGEWKQDLLDWCEATLAHMRAFPGLVARSRQIQSDRLAGVGEATVHSAVDLLVTRAGLEAATALDVVGVLGMHCLAWELTMSSSKRLAATSMDEAMVADHLAFLERGFRQGVGWILDGATSSATS